MYNTVTVVDGSADDDEDNSGGRYDFVLFTLTQLKCRLIIVCVLL